MVDRRLTMTNDVIMTSHEHDVSHVTDQYQNLPAARMTERRRTCCRSSGSGNRRRSIASRRPSINQSRAQTGVVTVAASVATPTQRPQFVHPVLSHRARPSNRQPRHADAVKFFTSDAAGRPKRRSCSS